MAGRSRKVWSFLKKCVFNQFQQTALGKQALRYMSVNSRVVLVIWGIHYREKQHSSGWVSKTGDFFYVNIYVTFTLPTIYSLVIVWRTKNCQTWGLASTF